MKYEKLSEVLAAVEKIEPPTNRFDAITWGQFRLSMASLQWANQSPIKEIIQAMQQPDIDDYIVEGKRHRAQVKDPASHAAWDALLELLNRLK